MTLRAAATEPPRPACRPLPRQRLPARQVYGACLSSDPCSFEHLTSQLERFFIDKVNLDRIHVLGDGLYIANIGIGIFGEKNINHNEGSLAAKEVGW